MSDLLAVMWHLRPLVASSTPGPVPRWWGRATQALFLQAVADVDEALAARLHEDSQVRPFSASTVMGRFPDHLLAADERYRFRLTTLEAEVSDALQRALQPGGRLAVGAEIELAGYRFVVQEVQMDDGLWCGAADYSALARRYLGRDKAPAHRLGLRFTSPVTFRSQGMSLPVPLPGLVFGSLLQRWNAFSPIAFPEETRRYAESCLAISRYQLQTRTVELKQRARRSGAVGDIFYVSLNYDRYWMGVLQTLADFALFSGVGGGASFGLGQCRRES